MHIHPPQLLLEPAATAFYRCLRATVAWRIEDPHAALDAHRPAIYACRHGELLPLLFAMEGRGLSILVSRSRDGELLASVLTARGFRLLRGSSSRAQVSAAKAALSCLAAGDSLGLAIDGPRGPNGVVQPGALRLAQRSGAVVVPLRLGRGPRLVLENSWDRFEIPLPFLRCPVQVGPPLSVGAGEAGIESAGRRLALALGGSYGQRAAPALSAGLSGYGNS